jgi:hypothetical protein
MFWHDLKLRSFFKTNTQNPMQIFTFLENHIYLKMINKEHVIYWGSVVNKNNIF